MWSVVVGCMCVVGRIATQILKCSNFVNLYLKNMNKTGMSGWTSEGRGFMLSSNKMYYSGHLCEENAIYLKTICSKLTEIQPIHVSWYNLPSFLSCLCLSPAPSPSPSDPIQPCPPAFCCLRSNSEVYSCNYATSMLGLASD